MTTSYTPRQAAALAYAWMDSHRDDVSDAVEPFRMSLYCAVGQQAVDSDGSDWWCAAIDELESIDADH